ncbi:hypothetical protein ACVWXQ_001820 [Bradyrhizobium sp. S3.14.4]
MAERIAIFVWLLFNGTAFLLALGGGVAGVAYLFGSDALDISVAAYLCALLIYLIGKVLCWVLIGGERAKSPPA